MSEYMIIEIMKFILNIWENVTGDDIVPYI